MNTDTGKLQLQLYSTSVNFFFNLASTLLQIQILQIEIEFEHFWSLDNSPTQLIKFTRFFPHLLPIQQLMNFANLCWWFSDELDKTKYTKNFEKKTENTKKNKLTRSFRWKRPAQRIFQLACSHSRSWRCSLLRLHLSTSPSTASDAR